MALHLSSSNAQFSDSGSDRSSSTDDADETWDDWVSDSMENRPCKSLFEQDKTFTTVAEAVNHDKLVYGIDLDDLCARLSLDPYQRIRLINWIRKEKPAPSGVLELQGTEQFLSSDEYLIPVLEDDPLLQLQSGDWSDSDDDEAAPAPTDLASATRRIQALERKLQQAKRDLAEYRILIGERLGDVGFADAPESSSSHYIAPLRDDDTHYFSSYAYNDIHATMIQDKVRTATYAKFILSSSTLFRDAVVLDVGCGTGILSLFAARAGAKRVLAVDASGVAEKARQIVKDNKLDDIITVIRGKVEDITLPDGITQVDVIISEWMGYALLYESMLDSVLRARDRFLRPDGVMAPSQSRMMLALCEGSEIFKERISFWSDVYGFELSAMANEVYDDAIVDVVGPETMVSAPYTIKDLNLGSVTPAQLDFAAPFTLTSTAERRTKVHAFVLYFDTFFAEDGQPVGPDVDVHVAREGDPVLAEVWPVGGRPNPARRMSSGDGLKGKSKARVTSFSTGPESEPTHWKQTIFLLRDPIHVHEGTVVEGTFICHKNVDNSRELDVEIHYVVKDPSEELSSKGAVVQMFKVR
ncbi:arginine N-methyltransferase 3 [Wolfiporia cocos MD-104 SS10]|uniref:type I protein arginine methyltransferase n=1 Tax=Wolfiporia cocos (strain MD-104) TaxID=742152 RepID=A0A2H3JKQ2_WOLCO|nr:arginine N-methyltransferase 3 [Wolfiporia cocos MD-104 SS10]